MKKEELDKLIEMLGPRVVKEMNPVSFIKDGYTDFDGRAEELFSKYLKNIEIMNNTSLSKIKRDEAEAICQDLVLPIVYELNELGALDVDRMILVCLDAYIINIQYEKNKAVLKGVDHIYVSSEDIETVQECKKRLDGKDIVAFVPHSTKKNTVRIISSVDACAQEVYTEGDNDPGYSALMRERRKRKEERDRRLRTAEKRRRSVLSRTSEELLNVTCDNLTIEELVSAYDYSIDKETSEEKLKKLNKDELVSAFKEIIKDNIDHIDIEKLLLIAAFKHVAFLREGGETQEVNPNDLPKAVKNYLKSVSNALNADFHYSDMKKRGLKTSIDIGDGKTEEYSLYDLDCDIERILPSGIFASKELISDTRTKIASGELPLTEVKKDLLEYMNLSFKEKTEYAVLSSENFLFAIENFGLSDEQLKSLVPSLNNISNELLGVLRERGLITHEDEIRMFASGKLKDLNEENQFEDEQVNELYEKGEIDDNALMRMYTLGKIDEETMGVLVVEYDLQTKLLDGLDASVLKFEDMIKLDETGATDTIKPGYIFSKYTCDDENNRFQTLEPLFWGYRTGKLTIDELEKLYTEFGVVREEDLYKAALRGCFTEDLIEELFLRSMLSNDELDNLCEKGIVSEERKELIKEKLSLDIIQASYPFSGSIEKVDLEDVILLLPDEKMKPGLGSEQTGKKSKKQGKGMDPAFKLDVLSKLNVPISEISEKSFAYNSDNPFYNYNFFVVTGKDGIIRPDSIVIAERLYHDRVKRTGRGYGDATYVLSMQDLKRIGKQNKRVLNEFLTGKKDEKEDEKTEELEQEETYNTYSGIKRIIHRSEKSWSIKLAKTISEMLGKSKKSMYTPEELRSIEASVIDYLKDHGYLEK